MLMVLETNIDIAIARVVTILRYTLRSDYPKTELGQSTRFSQSHRKIHCSRPLC